MREPFRPYTEYEDPALVTACDTLFAVLEATPPGAPASNGSPQGVFTRNHDNLAQILRDELSGGSLEQQLAAVAISQNIAHMIDIAAVSPSDITPLRRQLARFLLIGRLVDEQAEALRKTTMT